MLKWFMMLWVTGQTFNPMRQWDTAMGYFALISWLDGEEGWRCTCSEIWDGVFLLVFAMEGLSITKCQSVPQQSCIPYFCSYKNINQKGLKQVQSLQTDTQTSLLVKGRTELVRLHVISYRRGLCHCVEILEILRCGLVR